MKRNTVILTLILVAGAVLIAPKFLDSNQFHDLDDETPRFVTHEFTQLYKIETISKFRSGAGHDFSDDSESCRSMKHYYAPYPEYIDNDIEVYSPVDGEIVELWMENPEEDITDYQVHIKSEEYPAFTIRLFHIIIDDLKVGDKVEAGEHLGYAFMSRLLDDQVAHDFDIAVYVRPQEGRRYVHYFHILTDQVFQAYIDRGATSRNQFAITKEYRDANPLSCDGEWFTEPSVDDDWVQLD